MIFSVKIPFSLELDGWVIDPDLQEEMRCHYTMGASLGSHLLVLIVN